MLEPLTLLTVMFVTFTVTSKGLDPFWVKRPRTTVQSEATGGLRSEISGVRDHGANGVHSFALEFSGKGRLQSVVSHLEKQSALLRTASVATRVPPHT